MSDITLDVGLAYKIKQALSRNGIYDVADLDWLATGDNIVLMRRVRLGHAEVITPDHIIDCDADPFVPTDCGWEVVEHCRCGAFKWDKDVQKDALYLSKGQQGKEYMPGNKLRKELEDKPVLNSNVLDSLLDHQHLIPEEWKERRVSFWGTIYRNKSCDLYVRCLLCNDGRWSWGGRSIVSHWDNDDPAAVLASLKFAI